MNLYLRLAIDMCLSYMHDLEISTTIFIMIFSEIMFVLILYKCGVVENGTHYIFHCTKYLEERQVFLGADLVCEHERYL